MPNLDDLRFQFVIVDKTSGETLVEDDTHLSAIDEFGGSESVDHSVARALRFIRRQQLSAVSAALE